MKISLFVHDLHPQIGHSRALIELINGLSADQKSQITLIEVIAYTSTDPSVLFASFSCPKKFIRVPCSKLSPFLFKMFFYHFYTFFYSLIFARRKIKIGIGIACLHVDIANIQFIHEQWNHLFFKQRKLSFISFLYKKILFWYFRISEYFFFTSKTRKYITIAQFISHFLENKFKTPTKQITLIPSAVNPNEFNYSGNEIDYVWEQLNLTYPQLKHLDVSKPIFLFVGAYERKGLDLVLEYLSKLSSPQLIIIGKPEGKNQWKIPNNIKYSQIEFTKNVKAFYEVSDIFIFPTYYEPFGLVIIEAYAMGLDLIIPLDNVGASEILPTVEGIYFFNQGQKLPQINMKKLKLKDKIERRSERLNNLQAISWENSAQIFYRLLKLNI